MSSSVNPLFAYFFVILHAAHEDCVLPLHFVCSAHIFLSPGVLICVPSPQVPFSRTCVFVPFFFGDRVRAFTFPTNIFRHPSHLCLLSSATDILSVSCQRHGTSHFFVLTPSGPAPQPLSACCRGDDLPFFIRGTADEQIFGAQRPVTSAAQILLFVCLAQKCQTLWLTAGNLHSSTCFNSAEKLLK